MITHTLALNGALVRACAESEDQTLTLPVPAVDAPAHVNVKLCLNPDTLQTMAAERERDSPTTYFVEPSFMTMQMLAKSVCSGDIREQLHGSFYHAGRDYCQQQFAARRSLAAEVVAVASTASLPTLPPAPAPGDATMPKWTAVLARVLDNPLNRYVHCDPLSRRALSCYSTALVADGVCLYLYCRCAADAVMLVRSRFWTILADFIRFVLQYRCVFFVWQS